jgi:tRNA (cmo5U34)-methyltransferase
MAARHKAMAKLARSGAAEAAPTLTIPREWTFRSKHVAEAFDRHVREQLPWYDIATGALAHFARHYVPQGGTVIDVGCSTGNVGRALAPMLAAREASLIGIDNSSEMARVYDAPGQFIVKDAREFDFRRHAPDLVVCFLSLMFVPVADRAALVERLVDAVRLGGAVIVFDKFEPRQGYLGTVNYRLTLAAKYEAGAAPEEIIRKELSIAGVQRPMRSVDLPGFVEVFRFGDFAGFVREKP